MGVDLLCEMFLNKSDTVCIWTRILLKSVAGMVKMKTLTKKILVLSINNIIKGTNRKMVLQVNGGLGSSNSNRNIMKLL